ncbi:hypothetical protein QUB70_01045 [Microcoleus sp. A003_D6]|uniref:hypothetical protein n=1 Tax=Microcoleus sp. A003_D6 TaxID=3055266 RepID=UPI002FCF0BFA
MPSVILAITFSPVQFEREYLLKAKTTFAALSVAAAADDLLGKLWINCRDYLPDSAT